ncbi:hypothetical protein Tco_1415373, partial [Tanacetum coccineum]
QWARGKLLLPVVAGAKDTTQANTERVSQTFSTEEGETKYVYTEGESSHQRICVNVLLPVVGDTKGEGNLDLLTLKGVSPAYTDLGKRNQRYQHYGAALLV